MMLANGEGDTTKQMYKENNIYLNRDDILLEISWQLKRIADQLERRLGS
jgi:hypothetical protein